MRWYCKRNKRKNWRKTYGRPFIMRRLHRMVNMVVSDQMAIAAANAIASSFAPTPKHKALKALALADVCVGRAEYMVKEASFLNKGFAK